MDYPISEFNNYCNIVLDEMDRRGYKANVNSIAKLANYINFKVDSKKYNSELFKGWHNIRYMRQCYFNLQEKFDCGGISEEEWNVVNQKCMNIFIHEEA